MDSQTINILLIEDNPDDVALIKRNMTQSPTTRFEVTPANRLEEGLEYLAGGTYDLVMLDLGLPDSHGLDTVSTVLNQAPYIPVVIMSGFDDEAMAVKAVQLGAQDYLVKGKMEGRQMERALSYAIERSRLQSELEQYTQELWKTEINLRKILEKNADAIVVVGQGKHLLYANPAAETLLGSKKKELLNKPFEFPLSSGKTSEIEITYLDRAKAIAEMNVVEIDWEGKPAYLASLRDITRRKQVEMVVQKERNRAQNYLDIAGTMLLALDTNGEVSLVNRKGCEILGYKEKDIIGKDWFANFIPERMRNDIRNVFTQIMNGEIDKYKQVGAHEVLCKNGEEKIVFWNNSVVKDETGKIIGTLSSGEDITEQKKAEEALQESEEKFSSAFRASPDIIAITTVEDGTYIEINESFTRVTGFTREEIIGKKTTDLDTWVNPGDREKIKQKIQQNGRIYNEECQFRVKSGKIHTMLFSTEQISIKGKPCLISVFTDITERKQMEEALKESEEKFFSAFRSSPNSMAITRISDGKFIEVNDSHTIITGHSREDTIGHTAVEIGVWANEEDRTHMLQLLEEQGRVINHEYQFRMKSGELRTWLFSADSITIGGEPCLISMTTDITEMKQMEEALRESQAFNSSLLDNAPTQIMVINPDTSIRYVNPKFEEVNGWTLAEISGIKAPYPWWPKDVNTEEHLATTKESLKQDSGQVETTMHKKNGELYWVSINWAAVKEGGKLKYCLINSIDISERKEAEQALRFSDAAFKSIHESVIATDTQYNITHWNDISAQIYGIKADDAIGKKLLDIIEIVENKPGENIKRFEMLEANGYYREEQLHRTKHGEVWVDVNLQAIEDEGNRYGWVILATAITQRKLAEEALKRSEEKYRELISTSIDGIISFDPQLRIMIWNQGAEKIFGYMENEMLGQNLLKIISDKDNKRMTDGITRLYNRESSSVTDKAVEVIGLRKDGSEVPLELSISSRRVNDSYIFTAIIRDITERKQAEEAITRAAKEWRTTFDSINEMISVIDKDYRIVRVNKSFAKAFNKKPEEMLNRICYELFHEPGKPVKDCPLKKAMKTKKPAMVEYFEPCLGIFLEETISPVFNDQGDVVYCVHVSRDITERKQAEENLRKIDRMKMEFLSNVSHELRTPLQSISGFVKLIINGQVPDPETQQEFLQIVDRESWHLGNLINGLLDMSRLESGRFQINKTLVPLGETITDSVKIFHSLAREKSIELTEDIPVQLPEMEVDAERFRQVVINLLSNSIKFNDPGGNVNFKAERHNGEILFEVSDNGIGISEDAMEHLFERFYRSEDKLARGGTGLGLYITKQIIEAHGGRVWVKSKIGEGSTFSFTLPLKSKGGNGNGEKNLGD